MMIGTVQGAFLLGCAQWLVISIDIQERATAVTVRDHGTGLQKCNVDNI